MAPLTRVISRTSPARRRRNPSGAFTLIECLIATVFLALSVAGLAGALAASSKQTAEASVSTSAASLARQLMEEIVSRPYDAPTSGNQPGWPSNQDKSTYDDIGDFNSFSETIAANSDATPGPASIRYVSYNRSISIENRATPSGASVAGGDFAMITVTVTPSSMGSAVTLHRIAARFPVTRD